MIALVGAGVILLRFAFWGAFRLVLPVRSPVHAEAIVGLSFLLVALMRASLAGPEPWTVEARRSPVAPLMWIAALTILPYLITLGGLQVGW